MLLEQLSFQSRKTPQQLMDFAKSAGRRYKVFPIEKRSGGERLIEQPSRSVKAVQRWLDRALFRKYPMHDVAMGYRKGISIRENALIHAPYKFTLRLDFENFFWSFTRGDLVAFFSDNVLNDFHLTPDEVEFVSLVATRNDRLVMGAPSSPSLTNIMMFALDKKLCDVANEFHAKYTRYADDLFFSSNDTGSSTEIEGSVIACVAECPLPRLTLNQEKTAFLSRKSRRTVTGLVVTPQRRVSLGRERKRMIKALTHKAINGQLEKERLGELAGYLNWSKSADPEFVVSLRAKYGTDFINKFSIDKTN